MLAFPPTAKCETIAAYFLQGIELGLFEPDCAKDWAYSIVESEESPSIAVIDVASANRREDAISALSVAAQGAELSQAGTWLLEYVLHALRTHEMSEAVAACAANNVACRSSFPTDVWFWLTGLDESCDFASVESTLSDALAELHLLHPGFCGAV